MLSKFQSSDVEIHSDCIPKASKFINLELSQSFLSAEDLGSEYTNREAELKPSPTHAHQQMASVANVAAFRRSKVNDTPNHRAMSPISSLPSSGNHLQKSVQSGANKTPPMSAVNVK
uniref:AlNc14C4G566 protein n=1 Tax=Albugo laibachii Nc14 TaxID=890382 RepID=F0W0C3_9STRA|nr:AlNc14C4G566 [Albugo laibachii Nc14]|eukprot:CCA14495.1 AlNc14C4G566 [Albugo laibachii Nc14]